MNSDELESLYGSMSVEYGQKLNSFYQLRSLFAPLIEGLILLDRLTFLLEQVKYLQFCTFTWYHRVSISCCKLFSIYIMKNFICFIWDVRFGVVIYLFENTCMKNLETLRKFIIFIYITHGIGHFFFLSRVENLFLPTRVKGGRKIRKFCLCSLWMVPKLALILPNFCKLDRIGSTS